ncbi:nuclear transport factor 2 family protein [Actinomadura sp. DC4]|uniref:nuclear transport factor 2 family protein n=1 Tax=Actinomadura sp. DC4 TaxID=3055069 RepID=UPI0025B231FB|nr:nuclear transport factor 2 family protein [Actinomadura sp. DC4]MDN3352012.1 nuclear transport factor 2 family protein [Actinomadura sp. DC4]
MHPFGVAIAAGDMDAAIATLSADVAFRSPIVFRPYQGREAVGTILRAVARVFEDFRYTRDIGDAADHALVFSARVGGREIEGCDFLHLAEDGSVAELVVMVRPLTAANALAEAMAAQLAPDGG